MTPGPDLRIGRSFLFQVHDLAHEIFAGHRTERTVRSGGFGIDGHTVRPDMFAADRHGHRGAGMFAQMERHGMIGQDREGDAPALQRLHHGRDDAVFQLGDRLLLEFEVAEMRTFVDRFQVQIDQIVIFQRLERGLRLAFVIGTFVEEGFLWPQKE